MGFDRFMKRFYFFRAFNNPGSGGDTFLSLVFGNERAMGFDRFMEWYVGRSSLAGKGFVFFGHSIIQEAAASHFYLLCLGVETAMGVDRFMKRFYFSRASNNPGSGGETFLSLVFGR